ncbi:rhodanese-like domain-containing protein [Clostridium chrysemydis]|uniref:rhodanese-like domain-containing protein n=1 Tax=Clostridium chrysemydis TaxID=2665504 RepID=UPI0018842081|nr:rhodanese-like domain-containing protein [Clostridium chrysemydis]
MANIKSIEVNKLTNLKDINLIDIREEYEYSSGHLKNAKNIPMEELLEAPDEFLKEEETYYIICKAGMRSLRACSELKEEGYKVINVSGGTLSFNGDLEK